MGAGVIESISIPRFRRKSVAASSSPPVVASSISSSFGRRGLRFATAFSGLRNERLCRRVTSAGGAPSRGVVVRRGAVVVCKAQDTAIEVRDVTKDTWKSFVTECEKPVLVEFWAPWCGPCRVILPVIGKLSKMYEGKMECYKLNTDECPDIATQHGIRSIPTIIIFKNGEKKDTVIGAVPESTLLTCIEKFV